ncbi:MAG: two-component system response regulator [Desulfovibrionaceae bacterium]|nr:two-component system response regulator [Desulfovibrionaceae bacterium]
MDAQRRSRVLIVDDAPENIRILVESLKNEYTIMFARNGEAALRLAKSSPPPDVILLDVVMPGMDGYEVCHCLKADPQTHDIPVLFVTAQSEEVDEARGLALGAVDYISKPFRSSLVMTRVANQLELKRHRDSLDELVHERTRELALTQEVTIEAMATLAEWRDPETGGHIKRTQSYVRTLAEYMRTLPQYADLLDAKTVDLLYLSAPLHDVGKVSTPDAVLLKPGALTENEYSEMKLHTTRGRDALAAAEKKLGGNSFLRLAREIAYGHHERWDGKGYPQGLKGEAIPLSARLMSVADVYDALTSKRVYKPAMSHEEAASIIIEGRGTQFDPAIVDAFVVLQDKFREIVRQYADSESS